ncbi:MAG TPA: hypothetical protein VE623_19485 [Acidimicrobiales bacterium]|nr:hypothetical protein [Acidimicrobiales bacterium]
MLSVLTVLALVPVIVVRLSGDGDEGRVVSGGPRDALATVRAAVGRTSAADSYEIDLVTTMTQPGRSSCGVFARRGPNSTLLTESTPNTLSGDAPWDTVERLGEGDVLLYAMFWPAGKADLPPREFPLSLDDAQPGGLEGQPDHIYAERLGAQVNGWNMDLLIFYGGTDPTGVPPYHTEPSAEARTAAQEQLARLVVPARV